MLAAVALGSCYFNPDTNAAADDADPNAPDADPSAADADVTLPDAAPGSPDANPACAGWGYDPIYFDECMLAEATGPLVLSSGGTYIYNTDSGTLTGVTPTASNPANEVLTALDPDVRVLIVDRLEIQAGATLSVVGAMPLVIVSWDDIAMQGTLNVNSTRVRPGPGSDPATCGSSTGTPGTFRGGGGGGALGGNGGDGGNDGGANGAKGESIGTPSSIRGGCGGGVGGAGIGNGGKPGVGGSGGGAVYLVAQTTISVGGVLHAGGAGGQGAQLSDVARAAGGGGGSGGYIGLEAPTVTVASSAVLAANGGGGGGGTDFVTANDGRNGQPSGNTAAEGGGGVGDGGDGGDGGILGSLNGGNGETVGGRGNGGGGGGVGFIIVNSANFSFGPGATLSPAETLNP